jgi:hypothetical protein
MQRRLERMAELGVEASVVAVVAARRNEVVTAAEAAREQASRHVEVHERLARVAEGGITTAKEIEIERERLMPDAEYLRGALDVQRWLREKDMALGSLIALDSINIVDTLAAELQAASVQLPQMRVRPDRMKTVGGGDGKNEEPSADRFVSQDKLAAVTPLYKRLEEEGGPKPSDPSTAPPVIAESFRYTSILSLSICLVIFCVTLSVGDLTAVQANRSTLVKAQGAPGRRA